MGKPFSPIIVALDSPDQTSALNLLGQLDPNQCQIKIGKTLFTRYGPSLIRQIQSEGFAIFLDLKFHDIPQQVVGACQAAADLGVWLLTIHAMGGAAMLSAASEAVQSYDSTHLLAVTVLTSLNADDLQQLGITETPAQLVLRLANLAEQYGVDGVVSSPQEARLLRQTLSRDRLIVTPGIRLPKGEHHDQARTLTPGEAIKAGADYLVIGRPITQADSPRAALEKFSQCLKTS